MLDISYMYANFADIQDLVDFWKSPLPEMTKVKSLYTAIKETFKLPTNCIKMSVMPGDSIYRYFMESKDKKRILGWVVYLPKLKRLDLYTSSNPSIPLIQWKGKKVAFNTCQELLITADIEKLFVRMISVI